MAENENKYVSPSRLSLFLENLNNKFAQKEHSHAISDITDYTVDTELSSTSTNPVQNKVLDAEFEAIATSMGALETAIDGKLETSELPTAITAALAEAKESGEFDGEDGYSPVRGTDYWTEDDKAEIKAYVDEAILGGAW